MKIVNGAPPYILPGNVTHLLICLTLSPLTAPIILDNPYKGLSNHGILGRMSNRLSGAAFLLVKP